MMNDPIELEPMPLVAAVQVLRYRPNAETQVLEPWPVATIRIDAAGRIEFFGDASKAYEPLLRATRKAGAKLARQSLQEALSEAGTLRDNLEEPLSNLEQGTPNAEPVDSPFNPHPNNQP